MDRNHPGGLVHLGAAVERITQVWVQLLHRVHLGLEMEKHHDRGVGIRKAGGHLRPAQLACLAPVEPEAAEPDRANLKRNREDCPHAGLQSSRTKDCPTAASVRGKVGVQGGPVLSRRVQTRSFAELELQVFHPRRERVRRRDDGLLTVVVHERQRGPVEVKGPGAIQAQLLAQRAAVSVDRSQDLLRCLDASTPSAAGVAWKPFRGADLEVLLQPSPYASRGCGTVSRGLAPTAFAAPHSCAVRLIAGSRSGKSSVRAGFRFWEGRSSVPTECLLQPRPRRGGLAKFL